MILSFFQVRFTIQEHEAEISSLILLCLSQFSSLHQSGHAWSWAHLTESQDFVFLAGALHAWEHDLGDLALCLELDVHLG